MSTEAAAVLPETKPPGSEPPSEAVKNMAAEFMKLRTGDTSNSNPGISDTPPPAPKTDAPTLVPKTTVDKLLGPTPPKKEEPVPADADPLAEFKDAKPEDLPKIKAKARELIGKTAKELETLRVQLEEAKKAPAVGDDIKTRLDALEKERNELAEAVKIGSPERSEEYQQMGKERTALVERAANKLSDLGGDPEKLKEALALAPGKARTTALKAALSELETDDRTVLRMAVEEVEKLEERRRDFVTDADKKWTTLQQEKAGKAKQSQEAQAKEIAADFAKLRKELPETYFMLKTAEDAPEWNETVNQAFEEAQAMARGERPRGDVLKTLAMGLRAADLTKLFLAERAKREELEKKLGARASAGPGIQGGKPPPQSNGERPTPGRKFADMLATGQIKGD